MYFMGRASAEDSAAAFIVTGQSGRVYTVVIPRKGYTARGSARNNRFRCNCIDNIINKGTCKHMMFVCLRVGLHYMCISIQNHPNCVIGIEDVREAIGGPGGRR